MVLKIKWSKVSIKQNKLVLNLINKDNLIKLQLLNIYNNLFMNNQLINEWNEQNQHLLYV